MSYLTDNAKQSQIDTTQQNINDQNSQLAYQRNLIDLYNTVNTDATNLFNAQNTNYNTRNNIAVKNPASFAKQVALADFLGRERASNGGAGGGPANLSPTARAALTELQQQAMNNLLASPKTNPVPSASSVQSPVIGPRPILGQPGYYGDDSRGNIPGTESRYGDERQPATPAPPVRNRS